MSNRQQKILFITANRMGDAVLSTGLLAWLLAKYPKAQITIACGSYAAQLFEAVPHLERLIILNKKTWNRNWLKAWSLCIATRWDTIVDLRNSAVSRLLFTSKRYNYTRSSGQHKLIDNAAILNITPLPPLHIWLSEEAHGEANRIMPTDRKVVALAPTANWPPKQWPLDRFIALAQKIAAPDGLLPGATFLVFAAEHERDYIKPLIDSLPKNQCIELIGHHLLTVAACMSHCQLFVGNDSGLMHLASAIGTPTIGLFGPGQDKIYAPWGEHCRSVRTLESCEELLSRIPNRHARSPNLMHGLEIGKVYEAAISLLNKES